MTGWTLPGYPPAHRGGRTRRLPAVCRTTTGSASCEPMALSRSRRTKSFDSDRGSLDTICRLPQPPLIRHLRRGRSSRPSDWCFSCNARGHAQPSSLLEPSRFAGRTACPSAQPGADCRQRVVPRDRRALVVAFDPSTIALGHRSAQGTARYSCGRWTPPTAAATTVYATRMVRARSPSGPRGGRHPRPRARTPGHHRGSRVLRGASQ